MNSARVGSPAETDCLHPLVTELIDAEKVSALSFTSPANLIPSQNLYEANEARYSLSKMILFSMARKICVTAWDIHQ